MTGPALSTTLDERTRTLKERIYASFTGLAILAAVSGTDHATSAEALLSVGIGVLGISAAGFLAEVVAHQVTYQRLPAAGSSGRWGGSALLPWDRHRPRSSCSPQRGKR
jgi:hypothetical protein